MVGTPPHLPSPSVLDKLSKGHGKALITVKKASPPAIHRGVILELKNQTFEAPVQGRNTAQTNPFSARSKTFFPSQLSLTYPTPSNSAKLDRIAVAGPFIAPQVALSSWRQRSPPLGLSRTCVLGRLRASFLPIDAA